MNFLRFYVLVFFLIGCGASASNGDEGGGTAIDAGPGPNRDAFFDEDPPPAFCGPGDEPEPPLPSGTQECPDDKNREGCECHLMEGETAACWPGLRVDRERGICKDGVATCNYENEFSSRWGPCEGYVLPVDGATSGAQACNCFSAGRWEIDNTSPCFITYGDGAIYAVSTFVGSNGTSGCPTNLSGTPPPAPQPGSVWSTNRLTVDCSGQFELCYTLRAGSAENPQASDCTVATSCTEFWYNEPGVPKELPPLPSWTSSNAACSASFANNGGYGEMTVKGISVECEAIDDGGEPLVFHRVTYCSLECNANPSLPGCENCNNGASGGF